MLLLINSNSKDKHPKFPPISFIINNLMSIFERALLAPLTFSLSVQ